MVQVCIQWFLNKDFKCKHCDYCSTTENRLKEHIRNIHERPLKCEHCEKAFGDQKVLQDHISSVHSIVKEYKCEICSDMLATKKHLSHHLRASHDKKRPFKCSTCLKTFNFQKTLDQHTEREHKPENCERCPYCAKQYKRLKPHLEICNNRYAENERPKFKCTFCGTTLMSKDSLRGHEKNLCKKRPTMGIPVSKS